MDEERDTPTLCHVCRYVRPMRLMRQDETTRTMLHNPRCPLPGGLFVCDGVPCGSVEGATGRLLAGARMEKL